MPNETLYDPTPADRIDWTSNQRNRSMTITVGATQRLVDYHLPVKRLFITPVDEVSIGQTEDCDYDTIIPTATYEVVMPMNGGIMDLYDWFIQSSAGSTSVKLQYILQA
jgi:hypothetical protein